MRRRSEEADRDVRDLERAIRLIRRLDLEEVLEDLGIEVLWYQGADAYMDCPHPDHEDRNPSFHVCMEDVETSDGEPLLGRFNCWSHPWPGLRSRNFLDLVARVLFEIWEDEDGEPAHPTRDDRRRAAAYLRKRYVRSGEDKDVDVDRLADALLRRRSRDRRPSTRPRRELVWPESTPIDVALGRFRSYLDFRGIALDRAVELGVRAVGSNARNLKDCALARTAPAVLFPIVVDGSRVSWYARAVGRVPSRDKGRYAPGVPLAKSGVVYAPDPLDRSSPLVLVEGIFDRERVRGRMVRAGHPPGNVIAVLGGRVDPAQARRLRGFRAYAVLRDGDEGGATFSASIEDALGGHARVYIHAMPPGSDPGDAPEEVLDRALAEVFDRRVSGLRFRTRFRV